MSKQVTESYIDGIREGREFLKAHKPSVSDMRDILANIIDTLKGFSSGPVADLLRGERDFWRKQIAKREAAQ